MPTSIVMCRTSPEGEAATAAILCCASQPVTACTVSGAGATNAFTYNVFSKNVSSDPTKRTYLITGEMITVIGTRGVTDIQKGVLESSDVEGAEAHYHGDPTSPKLTRKPTMASTMGQ